MFPELQRYLSSLQPSHVGAERRVILDRLAAYVERKRAQSQPARLVFICTHNSRRSQLGQVWAAVAAARAHAVVVEAYSGGTEVTAFNPRAVAALERAGLEVTGASGDNPRYQVKSAAEAPALTCFSKTYDDPFNPRSEFAAVMTCTDADERCPVVIGAEERISLPYEDPKAFDDSDDETRAYSERCRQIATEMLYIFDRG